MGKVRTRQRLASVRPSESGFSLEDFGMAGMAWSGMAMSGKARSSKAGLVWTSTERMARLGEARQARRSAVRTVAVNQGMAGMVRSGGIRHGSVRTGLASRGSADVEWRAIVMQRWDRQVRWGLEGGPRQRLSPVVQARLGTGSLAGTGLVWRGKAAQGSNPAWQGRHGMVRTGITGCPRPRTAWQARQSEARIGAAELGAGRYGSRGEANTGRAQQVELRNGMASMARLSASGDE